MSRTAEPDFQPISMLPVIAEMIEGGLADGREIYVSFQEVRSQQHVLDDDTVQRAITYHTEGLEFVDIYEEQLRRWTAVPLTAEQTLEVTRLQALIEPSRRLHRDGLALAQELARGHDRAGSGAARRGSRAGCGAQPTTARRPALVTLPPEISVEKAWLSEDSWEHVFRHRTLGNLGRIVARDAPGGQCMLSSEVSGHLRTIR